MVTHTGRGRGGGDNGKWAHTQEGGTGLGRGGEGYWKVGSGRRKPREGNS